MRVKKRFVCGPTDVIVGNGYKWGVEVTWDFYEPALTVQLFNLFVIVEWWGFGVRR